MTNTEIWIGILSGILTNIVVALATYFLTARRDRTAHEEATRKSNAQIAEIALNHLNSSYLAVKKLRTDVLSHRQTAQSEPIGTEVFRYILEGISRSLEQTRIAIMSNMADWRHYLVPDTKTANWLNTISEHELLSADIAPPPPKVRPKSSSEPVADASKSKPATNAPAAETALKSYTGMSLLERTARALYAKDRKALKSVAEEFNDTTAVAPILATSRALIELEDPAGLRLLDGLVDRRISEMDEVELHGALVALVRHHELNDTEVDGIPRALALAERLNQLPNIEPSRLASVNNQLAKLFYGAGDAAKSLELTEKAAQLAPNEPSFQYNLSLALEKLGDVQNAMSHAERAFALKPEDDDYLAQTIDLLAHLGRLDEAVQRLVTLRQRDAFKAMIAASKEPLKGHLASNPQGIDFGPIHDAE